MFAKVIKHVITFACLSSGLNIKNTTKKHKKLCILKYDQIHHNLSLENQQHHCKHKMGLY